MTENNQYDNPLGVVAPPPEAEDADLAQFLSSVNWKAEAIEEQLFDPILPDLPVCYTLEWQNVAFAPLGGIAGMNGRPGNGKTMSFSTMIAAILHPDKNYQGLRCLLPDEPSVLYIDTEMEMVNTQRTVRRIYQMVGWPQMTQQERLHTICLREVNDATSRWRKILKAIWQFKPTVVFLDGLIDVVNDFNDNKECQERIYQCMSVASHYNISMWCLLHLNPGSDKAVGHLGSFLERKATDIWLTAQDKDTQQICISHEKHRMRKAPDINYSVADDEHHYGIPTLSAWTPDMDAEDDEPASNGCDLATNMSRLLDLLFNENVDQYITADFEDAIRNRVKYIGLSGGKGSDYTVEKVKQYFVNNNMVDVTPGNRGSKIYSKRPF